MGISTCSGAISLSRELENESAKFYQELSKRFEKDKDLFLALRKRMQSTSSKLSELTMA